MMKQEKINIYYSDGQVKTQEAFLIVFYLRKSNLEIVSPIAEAIFSYVELVSIEALKEYYDDDGEQQELNKRSLEMLIDDRLLSQNRLPNAWIEIQGKDVFAPEYSIKYGGKYLYDEKEVSYLYFSIPTTFFISHRKEVIRFIDHLCTGLPFTFGYASIGMVGRYEDYKHQLAEKYFALDIADQSDVSWDLGTRVAGIYWLMLFGEDLCGLLGGINQIKAELPSSILVNEPAISKCKLTLGSQPILGDADQQELRSTYHSLAKYLERKNVLYSPHKRDAYVNSMLSWHERFLG